MSKLRYRWWGYVRAVIRSYPALRAQACLDEPQERREVEAVAEAIRQTQRMKDGTERLRLIDLVFWQQSKTLDGAAQAVHWSYHTARRKQGDFICLVAKCMGLSK